MFSRPHDISMNGSTGENFIEIMLKLLICFVNWIGFEVAFSTEMSQIIMVSLFFSSFPEAASRERLQLNERHFIDCSLGLSMAKVFPVA